MTENRLKSLFHLHVYPRGSKFFTLHSSLFTFCSFLILTGCEYKDLCYDHNHWGTVRVVFDWQMSPEALTKSAEAEPAGTGMTVLFYDGDRTPIEPVRYDLAGRYGGTVRLLPATWQAVGYNYDTETILYRGMESMPTLTAYTRESSIGEGTMMSRADMPRATTAEDEPVILEPDPLWAAASEPFTVSIPNDQTPTPQNDQVITIQPQSRVYEVTVTIRNVPNLQYTGQFGGALTGLAPSVAVASGQLGEGCATEAFTCQVTDATTLEMHVRIFGHCPHQGDGVTNRHLLTIYAILADGTKWYYTQDVSGQMHKEGQGGVNNQIHIELDGLPVPKPIVNGSGCQPTVDGWQGEEIEVTM